MDKMTVLKAIELFKTEMLSEIFNSSADGDLQDSLVEAVKEVEKTVIATYEATLKQQEK